MSFLAPLYIAGLAALALPILFHLIQRRPRGQVEFSSLMFLSASPPRLTRKSRLNDILLLLLRAAALTLLAIAFARPFLRAAVPLPTDPRPARRVAIVVDTSASMRRAGLWDEARRQIERLLADLAAGDDVALYAFDSRARRLVAFATDPAGDSPSEISNLKSSPLSFGSPDPAPAAPATQAARIRTAFAALQPGWAASDLGRAVVTVADELNDLADVHQGDRTLARRIVVVSDLQEGSRLEALAAYEWPGEVELAAAPVAPRDPTNAGLHHAPELLEETAADAAAGMRVRILNDRFSRSADFTLAWVDAAGKPLGSQPVKAHVAPGEDRTLRVPLPPGALAAARRLRLTGDTHDFDNTLYFAAARQEEVPILYLGADAAGDVQGLRYYLERALPETPRQKTVLQAHQPDAPLAAADLAHVKLVILAAPLPEASIKALADYTRAGGSLLIVLADAASAANLSTLLAEPALTVDEAQVGEYAMLTRIDFRHPLFAPFADPRFNDFTKIHFWRYRRVKLPANVRRGSPDPAQDSPSEISNLKSSSLSPGSPDPAENPPSEISNLKSSSVSPDPATSAARVLAAFDTGDPALIERTSGQGRILVLTAGWQPADSQLARSSKFVPLLTAIIDQSAGGDPAPLTYTVGDPLPPPAADQKATGRLRTPDGRTLPITAGKPPEDALSAPGIYRLEGGAAPRELAVNIPAAESRTAAIDIEDLQRHGVALTHEARPADLARRQRQMRDQELESRQKLWQWLMLATAGVLIGETWLAGRAARRGMRDE